MIKLEPIACMLVMRIHSNFSRYSYTLFASSVLAFIKDDLAQNVSRLVHVALHSADQRVASIEGAVAFINEDGCESK